MKYILSLLIVVHLMTGCESKEEIERAKQAEIFKQEQLKKVEELRVKQEQERLKREEELKQAKLLAQKEAQERARLAAEEAKNPSVMKDMGFTVDDGKLIIDTNKAKEFFGILHKNLESVDKQIKEGNLSIIKPSGIEVDKHKVTVDLNKTESFLQSWGNKMEKFSKEIDAFANSLTKDEINNTKEQ